MKKLNQKGDSEVIGYIIVGLIVVAIVGMMVTQSMPIIKKIKSKNKFIESEKYIEEINQKIKEIMLSPVESTTSIQVDLEELFLEIDAEENRIEIYHKMYGEHFKEGEKIVEGDIYKTRIQEKLIVGINLGSIKLQNNLNISNVKTTLYIKKVEKNQLEITRTIDNTVYREKNIDDKKKW